MTHTNPYESSYTEQEPTRYEREVRMWAMCIHLSVLVGLVAVPLAGWILPIVLWQVKKDDMPELDVHGRIVVNWLISTLIYTFLACAICIPLMFVVIGIPLIIVALSAIYISNIAFAIVGGVKANSGEVWHYPFSFQII